MIITIDGPTASGKSTVARLVAQKLEIYYIASGLIYRALAYHLWQLHHYTKATIHNADHALVRNILADITYYYTNGIETVHFRGVDVTQKLKTSDVDPLASVVSTNIFVREQVNNLLRSIAHKNSVVIDGRDCGSVIFPHAEYKFFVTASLEVRALRWKAMQERLGVMLSNDQAQAALAERDARDMQRSIAPLVVPQGACIIDCSSISAHDVADQIILAIK